MATHLVTVGWDHPNRLIPAILRGGAPDKVLLLYSVDGDQAQPEEIGRGIAEWMKAQLEELAIPTETHGVDAFHPDRIVAKMAELTKGEPGAIQINITSGTKIMAIAGMMFASIDDRVDDVYYATAKAYGDFTNQLKERPNFASLQPEAFQSHGFGSRISVPKIPDITFVKEHHAIALIQALASGKHETMGDLIAAVKRNEDVHPNTVRSRVQDLADRHLVLLQKHGRTARPVLTPAGQQVARVLAGG